MIEPIEDNVRILRVRQPYLHIRHLRHEGRLSLDSWETQDGQKRSRLRVVAENFQFVGSRGAVEGALPAEENPAGRSETQASTLGERAGDSPAASSGRFRESPDQLSPSPAQEEEPPFGFGGSEVPF